MARLRSCLAPKLALLLVGAALARVTHAEILPATPEGVWILWVEAPVGSDQWSVAPVAPSRFPTKEACEGRARAMNDVEDSAAKTYGLTGEARDHWSCLPESVDPRP